VQATQLRSSTQQQQVQQPQLRGVPYLRIRRPQRWFLKQAFLSSSMQCL
jgi:hypothetical protein